MPRIDPERLLKCLLPLLEPVSGAIRSTDEVDKILGLMSKFSKKLVSKCIYINILKASNINVVDLFMQRGGWSLVFGWTTEAVTAKNFPLLREILQLLCQTPTTISRLKENRFPLVIKNLSKDCEDLETRNLAKQVVAKWISVAKGEENPQLQPVECHGGTVGMPINQMIMGNSSGSVSHEIGNINNVHSDPLLNIDPTFIPDADTENQLLDLDLSHADLSSIDFNLDILSKVVDPQPIEEGQQGIPSLATENSAASGHVPFTKSDLATNIVLTNSNTNTYSIPTVSSNAHILQQQQQPPVKQEVIDIIQVQQAPKIYIKTIGGQKTVVQSLGSEPGQYCLLIKGDKNYVVKVKEASAPLVPVPQREDPVQVPETTSSGIKSEDTPDSATKEKHIKLHKKEKDSKINIANKSKTPGSTIKTYEKSNKDGTTSSLHKKPSDQKNKSDKSDRDKEKRPSKESSSSSKEGHKRSKSSSSRSKAEAAAAAAKHQEEEEKLKEKIRSQKALVKKRQKEVEKQKQQEKDQETLKKLNLATTSPSSSLKIPKIPRKNTSFIDAIGIPGTTDGSSAIDKIKKVPSDKSSKSSDETATPSSPTKKSLVEKEASDTNDSEKKERRHKPKVFMSAKSRSDDLLKEMTESGKAKTNKEKEKEKEAPKASTILGNSIPAVPPSSKISKRLSTDSLEKPGDLKKAKLDGNGKNEKSKETKESPKEKEKKPVVSIVESSLFMDMLTAEAEPTKSKPTRKRRLSTGSEKEKSDLPSPIEKAPKQPGTKDDTTRAGEATPEEPVKKPVFHFYRDTLNDSPDQDAEVKRDSVNATTVGGDGEDRMDDNDIQELSSFTPQENDGKLKSALCIFKARNRPKKSVRWREEDNLKEFHYFEMDETERVNVTKQKDFTEMSQHEKAIERSHLRRKPEDEDVVNQWRLRKIDFKTPVLQPPCNSQEKLIQEERERTVLELFLPPGYALPDTAVEPDPTSPVDKVEARSIPVEDVNSITKVCDFRTHAWPAPKEDPINTLGYSTIHQQYDQHLQQPLNVFPQPVPDYNNPWNNSGFSVPPPVQIPTVPDLSPFNYPPPNPITLSMNFIGTAPSAALGFANPNPFAFPPPGVGVPQVNGPQGAVDSFTGLNRDTRMANNRGGRFNDSDQRRNFHSSRDRDGDRDRSGNRDRDYRNDRGGRDRDFRRRDRDGRGTNDRDYRHHDRDRDRDHRSGSSGRNNTRKDVPCKYFKNGYCGNGNNCKFLHDAPSHGHEDGKINSRQDSLESSRSRRSPDTHNKDVDLRKSSNEEDWEDDQEPKRSSISEAEDSRFALPPSSPADPEMPSFSTTAESTKVIPV